ncbi:hypothetical protein HDV57DRAFT_481607 [Trichoderma longibrachiatum]
MPCLAECASPPSSAPSPLQPAQKARSSAIPEGDDVGFKLLSAAYRYRPAHSSPSLIRAKVSGIALRITAYTHQCGTLSHLGGHFWSSKLTEPQRCDRARQRLAQCCQSCAPSNDVSTLIPHPFASGPKPPLVNHRIALPLPDSPSERALFQQVLHPWQPIFSRRRPSLRRLRPHSTHPPPARAARCRRGRCLVPAIVEACKWS